MNKTEAIKQALDAITQYLAESPDPSEEAVENLCDARAVLGKTLAQPEQEKQPAQKRPQNCGTSYCSCIECVMEPAQQGNGVTMEEAWKLALEALESLSMNDYSGYEISKHETYKIDNAITALREARAEQPAQRKPLTDEQIDELVRADEREACAMLAEKLTWADNMGVASAIRARGNT